MKKLLFIALMLASFASYAQPQFGGQVGGYDNSATKKFWMFKGGEGKVWDSTGNVFLSGIKSLDSSINAKLTSGVPVTFSGHDSTTDSRVGIKLIQNPTITNTSFGISGTLPAFASTPTVNIGTGMYTVSASDSTKYRIGIKVLQLPGLTELNLGNIDANTANLSSWADNNSLATPAETGSTPVANGWQNYGLVSTTSPTLSNGRTHMQSITEKGGTRVTLIDMSGNYVDVSGGGGGGGGLSKFTSYDTIGSVTSMTVTNLNSLANSATIGWQSDRVDNITSTKATDYRVFVKATMSNTAPANDKTLYVYAAPFYYDGSTWQGPSLGTTSQASGTQGSCTIASAAPNNLVLLGVLSYSTQNMVLQSTFNLSNAFGRTLPDGFSIVIINFTGSAIAASGNVVSYKPVYQTNR